MLYLLARIAIVYVEILFLRLLQRAFSGAARRRIKYRQWHKKRVLATLGGRYYLQKGKNRLIKRIFK